MSVRGILARARPCSSLVSMGQREGGGPCRFAGLRNAEHVAACEHVAVWLAVGWALGWVLAGRLYRGENFFGQAEL